VTKHRQTARPRPLLNKVPQITVYFWLIKVLCTTVGDLGRRRGAAQAPRQSRVDRARPEDRHRAARDQGDQPGPAAEKAALNALLDALGR
jgi:hypothetical protein